jgi:hypothetical protein
MKQFDWWGFGVRGFCGGLLGALLGWRVWIRLYSKRELDESWEGLVVCMLVGFVVVGVIVGFRFLEATIKQKTVFHKDPRLRWREPFSLLTVF